MTMEFQDAKTFEQEIGWLRGVIIEKSLKVETLIDRLLVHFYAGDDMEKRKIFYEGFIKESRAGSKINHLNSILKYIKERNPNWKIKEDLVSTIKRVFELRNKVAHCRWTMIFPEFIQLKDNGKLHTIKKATRDRFDKDCNDSCANLDYILHKMDFFNVVKKQLGG